MKVLAVNNHYFLHGGPDRYFFNVKEALEKRGHTVVPFSFEYVETIDTPYREYFPEPITGRGPCLLHDMKLSNFSKFKTVLRMFHNNEVNTRFCEIIRMEKPDLVFSIYLSSSFLPNILAIAKKEFKIPVVYRLSDFHMFCASYTFFRAGKVCTKCLSNSWSAVKYRCVHESSCASLLRSLQISYVRLRGWYESVDAFICPSELMTSYLIERGIAKEKVYHVPTFARDFGHKEPDTSTNPYILYFGRIVPEKGVETLLKAFNRIEKPTFYLKLMGNCSERYHKQLITMLDENHRTLVEIRNPEQGDVLIDIIQDAQFIVHPALCLENMPNTVLESMAVGKAIVASALGSMPELVKEGMNGRLFSPGNASELAQILVSLVADPYKIHEMGAFSRVIYERTYTEEVHMKVLLQIFDSMIGNNKTQVFHEKKRLPCLYRSHPQFS